MYARFIFTILSVLVFQHSFCQIDLPHILVHNDPKYKSFLIGVAYNSNFIDEGTAFILKRGNRYFLVTNYHVLTGRSNEDTVLMTNPNIPEPNIINMRFHGKNEGVVDTGYLLKDLNGRRLYLSVPANKITRKTVDIVFFEIKQFPRNAEIDPIDMTKINKTWIIGASTKLFLFGFAFVETAEETLPRINTLTTIPDSTFSYKCDYILSYSPVSLNGGSGSPVYIKTKAGYVFVGVHSSTIPPEAFSIVPNIIKNKNFIHPVSVTLAAKNIFLLNQLDKSNP